MAAKSIKRRKKTVRCLRAGLLSSCRDIYAVGVMVCSHPPWVVQPLTYDVVVSQPTCHLLVSSLLAPSLEQSGLVRDIGVEQITCPDVLVRFVLPEFIAVQPEGRRQLLQYVLQHWSELKRADNLVEALKEVCVVLSAHGQLAVTHLLVVAAVLASASCEVRTRAVLFFEVERGGSVNTIVLPLTLGCPQILPTLSGHCCCGRVACERICSGPWKD